MRWLLKSADPARVDRLATELRANPALRLNDSQASTLARLLVMRGITEPDDAERFLAPSLAHLHSPYAMLGMKAAVDRLDAAIARQEGILIYGDYDVDGTTAIVILKTAIELCGGAADFHVPHRIREGYGMKDDVIERAAAAGVRLIISVDTGIRAFAAAETAHRLGVDLIVTDHHLPGQEGVPAALAVLNPNQPGCDYPCKALCGAGVAFKLAQALMERRLAPAEHSRLLMSFMKVVAIATIADAVPLTGENRVFAKLGLEGLRAPVNPGLRALLEVAQIPAGRPLTSGEVAFRIAPRLNAAGRMDVARDVIELFSVKDAARARELANRLDQLNAERQEEERRILDAIQQRFEQEPALLDAYCLVIDGDGWHRGVIGITATRVVERYNRPALVISRDGDEAHGSGRSIPAFHLLNALESCAPLFTRYGGHAHAVGFALPAARLPELCTSLDTYARARLTLADFEPSLRLDAELPLDQVTPELFQALRRLEPFGMSNPEPAFAAHNVRLMAPPRVMKDKHVKLKLAAAISLSSGANPDAALATTPRCDPDSAALRRSDLRAATENREPGPENSSWRRNITFDALGWHMAERLAQSQLLPGDTLDIAYSLDHNDHPEYGGLELSLRDFKAQVKTAENVGDAEGNKASVAR
ncbi:MAG: single-stranded-DNA-specific exonuclease RecJ [Acidobacteriia bacterium]|nr:single-stranded-DNA-specific exonuclease RecJ [Terriglobia bacterium]